MRSARSVCRSSGTATFSAAGVLRRAQPPPAGLTGGPPRPSSLLSRSHAPSRAPRRSAATLTRAERDTHVVGVSWRNDAGVTENAPFSHMWLRDNCLCPQCLHPKTRQRQVDTSHVNKGIAPAEVTIENQGRELKLVWKHDITGTTHQSVYPSSWLIERATSAPTQRVRPLLWDRDKIKDIGTPEVSFEEVMSGPEGMAKWVRMLHTHGYTIVTGTPATAEATQKVLNQIGPSKNGLFGLLWDFTVHADSQSQLEHCDTAYTSIALQPHSDGCYCIEPPGLQAFHILEHTGQGGDTVLVDGFNVASKLRANHPEEFQYLSSTPISFHYWDTENFLEAQHKVISLNTSGEVTRFIYNNDDRSPTYMAPQEVDRHYSAIHALLREIQSPTNQHIFRLSPGRLLVTNNWRVMHGRTAFSGSRRLSGTYISMDHFSSKTRTLLGSASLH